MVIGASGFLGSEICRLLGDHLALRTFTSQQTTSDDMRYDFFRDNIGHLLLCAAEIRTVIFASAVEMKSEALVRPAMQRFADACKHVRMVYLSSDGIFDGERGLYTEVDAPQPRTLYGRNLAACERILSDTCKNVCIIRPSYIYGVSAGYLDKRLAETRARLEAGEPVALFDDMFKSPLGVTQVAQAVVDLAESDYPGVVHVAGQRMSVYDFHTEAMQALGIDTSKLTPRQMPISEGHLRDTSLDTSLWRKLTGTTPRTVYATLTSNVAVSDNPKSAI
jgi:dTDP-4-dehydrorhamnose reductase